MKKFRHTSDVISPNTYVGWNAIERVENEYQLKLEGSDEHEFYCKEDDLVKMIKFLQTGGFSVVVNQVEGD